MFENPAKLSTKLKMIKYGELKMMKNDTKNVIELWNFNYENRLLNFCVGETVGGHRPASLNLFHDCLFLNSQHFDTKLMSAAQRGKKLWPKIA